MARMAKTLAGLRVLIAEDDYLVGAFLADFITLCDGTMIGPVRDEKDVLPKIDQESVDCTIIDLKLNDAPCYPLIEALTARGVSVIITTGYPLFSIPIKFHRLPIFAKPYDFERIAECVADCCLAKAT